MKFKKNELYATLLILAAQTGDGKLVGLLHEDISLGLKRGLQKLMSEVNKFYQDYRKDLVEVNEKCKDDPKKLSEEIKILDEEDVEVTCEMVSLAVIEEIKTRNNYDFNLIQKFAK